MMRQISAGNHGQIRLTRKRSCTFIALVLNPSLIGSKNNIRKASMSQKKDEYLASLSQQQPDMPIEELTFDPKMSLQLLIDEVRRHKGKEIRDLRAGRVGDLGGSSTSSPQTLSEMSSRLQQMEMKLVTYPSEKNKLEKKLRKKHSASDGRSFGNTLLQWPK